jgi:hypothetical protein
MATIRWRLVVGLVSLGVTVMATFPVLAGSRLATGVADVWPNGLPAIADVIWPNDAPLDIIWPNDPSLAAP